MSGNSMHWVLDMDGVITANPAAFSFLTHHLHKNENGHRITVLSWRDGSKKERRKETESELKMWGITYDRLVMSPSRIENERMAARWKVSTVSELKANVWMDNDLKRFRTEYGIDLEAELPSVHCVQI